MSCEHTAGPINVVTLFVEYATPHGGHSYYTVYGVYVSRCLVISVVGMLRAYCLMLYIILDMHICVLILYVSIFVCFVMHWSMYLLESCLYMPGSLIYDVILLVER